MRLSLRVAAALVAVSAISLVASSASAQTVLTFDDLLGDNTAVPANYGGLTWDSGWLYYSDLQPPYTAESDPNRVYALGTSDLGFDFAAPTVFDGAYFAGYDFATVQFQLFLGGSLVGSSSILAPTDTPTFLASDYSGLVDRVVIDSPSYDFWVMDNVTFNGTNVVPEPGTLMLLGTGLVGLAGIRRRRRI